MASLMRRSSLLPRLGCVHRRYLHSGKSKTAVQLAATIRSTYSDEESASREFSRVLWSLNQKHQHRVVAEAFDALPPFDPLMNPSTVRAALLANAELRKSFRAKEIMEQAAYQEITAESVSYLLRAYTLDARLGSAERLMYAWLNSYCERNPTDNLSAGMRDWLQQSRSVQTQGKSVMSTFEFDKTEIGVNLVPLSAWVSMISMYRQRGAWRHCWEIVQYLENMRTLRGEYKTQFPLTPRPPSKFLSSRLHRIENASFEIGTEYNFGSDVEPLAISKQCDIVKFQWTSIYHETLRVLCQSGQFDLALHLFRRMSQTKDGSKAAAFSYPEISAVISLLHGFISPVIHQNETSVVDIATKEGKQVGSNQLSSTVQAVSNKRVGLQSDGAHVDSYENSIRLRRQIVGALVPEITSWIKNSIVGATPRRKSVYGSKISHLLAREFLLVLCRLDMLPEAKTFVTVILQCLLDHRYHQGSSESGGAESNDNEEKPEKGVKYVGGFSNNLTGWVSVYAQRLREAGEWEQLKALHGQLSDIENYDKQMVKSSHSKVTHRTDELSDSGDDLEDDDDVEGDDDDEIAEMKGEQLVGEVSQSGSSVSRVGQVPPKSTRRNARHKLFLYHDTTTALRKAGQLGKLAEVMTKSHS